MGGGACKWEEGMNGIASLDLVPVSPLPLTSIVPMSCLRSKCLSSLAWLMSGQSSHPPSPWIL